MEPIAPDSLMAQFTSITDPRVEGRTWHKLLDIVCIAICGVICGADGWVQIEEFGKSKENWFKRFLELPHGIPSHDTFGRFFCLLSNQEFERCFLSWVRSVSEVLSGAVVAIDGKELRRSHDRRGGKAAIHLVSAWAEKNRVVLGQLKTEDKSNEITAIPKLLEVLHLRGCIVTIDAMGCQREIAKTIVEQDADYVLAVKANQPKLLESVRKVSAQILNNELDEDLVDYHETHDAGHGRQEIRVYCTTDWLEEVEPREKWAGLRSIGFVESQRTEKGKTTLEYRYYVTSLKSDAKLFASAVRGHWGIENSLHWVLDVAFSEDQCRIRKENAAENFAVLRRIALNLLRNEKTSRVGVRTKRLKAAWDARYLEKVLNPSFF